MPRILDYNNRRAPSFARYVVLHKRVSTQDLLRRDDELERTYPVDPEFLDDHGVGLGLFFHSFVGEYEGDTTVAGLAS